METGIRVFLLFLSSQHCSTSPTWNIFQQIPDSIPLISVRPIFRQTQEHSDIPAYRPPLREIPRDPQIPHLGTETGRPPSAPNYFSNIPESGVIEYPESAPGSRKKLVYPPDSGGGFRPQVSTPVDIFTRPDYGLVSPTSSARPWISTEMSQKLAHSVNELSLAFHKRFASEPGNVVFSPLSISTALGMLYYGSRGRTAEDMRKTLKYDSANLLDGEVHQGFRHLMSVFSSSNEYVLDMANAFLAQRGSGIRPEYVSGLRYYYQAEVKDVDFATESAKTTRQINDWVAKKTNNKIDKLVDQLDPSTLLVILNAVYFKGTWQTEFNPRETRPFPFYAFGFLSPSNIVPMMTMTDHDYRIAIMENEGVKAIELPYRGKDVVMWIVLPIDKDGLPVDGLASLERRLSSDLLSRIGQNLSNRTLQMVVVPKFKLEYSRGLSQMLSAMGMRSAFVNANLSGISDNNLFVSDVIHKATIEVNEEGSEASAATAVTITRTGPDPSKSFIANYPFLFFISDKRNNMMLFTGKVTQL